MSPARIAPREPLGDPDEQLVPRRVTEGVVDDLEVVEVEEDDGDGPPVPPVQGQGVLQPVEEQRPVGQAGQHVVEGLVPQQRLAGRQLGGEPQVVPQRQVLPGEQRA